MEQGSKPTITVLGGNLRVHTHACGEGGIFVNAYLVETDSGIVAIDSTLTETESKKLRSEVEALKKPLLAVLITHPHPDHVAGITNLVAGDRVEIVATRPVFELMQRLEEPKRKQWTPVYGSEWVQKWTYPNRIVDSGTKLSFGGVTFSVLDVGPGGDAEQNSVWFIETPQRTAFLSDLVFNGTHSYVADGHLLAWLANLARLERECRNMEVVFPGHGGAGTARDLIRAQRDYLLTLAGYVKELASGRPTLDEAAKKELERRITADYPGHGLSFLIGMNADPIARELVGTGS
jgi:glyoxylase-like metal-dependent hydrolase (beta-lactamase superfamily II)